MWLLLFWLVFLIILLILLLVSFLLMEVMIWCNLVVEMKLLLLWLNIFIFWLELIGRYFFWEYIYFESFMDFFFGVCIFYFFSYYSKEFYIWLVMWLCIDVYVCNWWCLFGKLMVLLLFVLILLIIFWSFDLEGFCFSECIMVFNFLVVICFVYCFSDLFIV